MSSLSKKLLSFSGLVFVVALLAMEFYLFRSVPPESVNNFVKACGELNYKSIDKLDAKEITKICSVNCGKTCNNHKECISQYLAHKIGGRKVSREDDQFIIVHGRLDQGWRCKLDLQDNSMEGVPFYKYELY